MRSAPIQLAVLSCLSGATDRREVERWPK